MGERHDSFVLVRLKHPSLNTEWTREVRIPCFHSVGNLTCSASLFLCFLKSLCCFIRIPRGLFLCLLYYNLCVCAHAHICMCEYRCYISCFIIPDFTQLHWAWGNMNSRTSRFLNELDDKWCSYLELKKKTLKITSQRRNPKGMVK